MRSTRTFPPDYSRITHPLGKGSGKKGRTRANIQNMISDMCISLCNPVKLENQFPQASVNSPARDAGNTIWLIRVFVPLA